jgi:hypothetical protein
MRVVEFTVWARGINAFRKTECPNCGVPLRPSRRTYLVFAMLLVLVVPFVVALDQGLAALGVDEKKRRLIFACTIIPCFLAICFWEWRTGSYRFQKGLDSGARPGRAPDRPRD